MGRRVNAGLWASWRERLTRQQASGQSIAEYCRRAGISVTTFHQWKRKLAGTTTSSRLRPKTQVETVRACPETASDVRQLRLAGNSPESGSVNDRSPETEDIRFVQLALPPQRGSQSIELSLNDGTVIRVPSQNVAALEVILATLLGQRRVRSGEVIHA